MGGWIQNIHYSSEYLGWVVAATILFIFTLPLTFYSFAAAGVGIAPISIGFLFFFLNLVSATSISYFTTRTFASAESIEKVLNSNRILVLSFIAGVLVMVFLIALIAVNFFNASAGSVTLLSLISLLLLYAIVIGSGYDAARLRNTRDRVEARHNFESQNTYLYEIITGKSERKALVVGGLIILIGVVVALISSLDRGLSTIGAFGGIFAIINQLYPKKGN